MIKFNEVTWYSRLAAIIFFIGILPILTFYMGTEYQEAKNVNNFYIPENMEVRNTNINSQIATSTANQISETRKFRLYRKHDGYVYLAGSEYPMDVYYKSVEADKFKNYNELDYLEITASSYTPLPVVEEEFIGIRDYKEEIHMQINAISDIKLISEAEFNSR